MMPSFWPLLEDEAFGAWLLALAPPESPGGAEAPAQPQQLGSGPAARAAAVPAAFEAPPPRLDSGPGARAAGAAALASASEAPPERHDSGPGARVAVAGAGAGAHAAVPAAPAAHPDGISLAGLRAFVAEHGGEAGLAGKTTSDVKWAIVVPETKAAACSYADLLRAREGDDAVGRANAFISHVYRYAFLRCRGRRGVGGAPARGRAARLLLLRPARREPARPERGRGV